MSEFEIHCKYFPGKICHPDCPNYEANLIDILNTSKELDLRPENIASRIRVDPQLKIWANCQSQLNMYGLTQCTHNPIQ